MCQTIDYIRTYLYDPWSNGHPALGAPNDIWIIALKKPTNIRSPRSRSIRVCTLA